MDTMNTTSIDPYLNTTGAQGSLNYMNYQYEWRIGTIITCVEFVLAFVLNCFLIVLLLKKVRLKRSRMTYFVLHLAISDLAVAIFYILPAMVDRFVDEWLAGEMMCRFVKYLNLMTCYASTYMLVVLTADRAYAVVRPISATNRGIWYQRILVIAAWCIAAVFAIQDFIFSKLIYSGDYLFCQDDYQGNDKLFVMLFAVMNMFIPAIAITTFSLCILHALWRRRRKSLAQNGEAATAENNKRIMKRSMMKSIKITVIVVSVFILSWSPYTLTIVLNMYQVIPRGGYFFILTPLAPINSAANPIVYIVCNYELFLKKRNSTATKTTSHYNDTSSEHVI